MPKTSRGFDRWSHRHLLRESARNTFSTASAARWGLYVAALLGIIFAMLRAVELQNLDSRVAMLGEQGRNLLVVQSIDENQLSYIDRASCERLTEMPGVVAAGGVELVREVSTARFGTLQVFAGSETLFPMLNQGVALLGTDLVQAPTGTDLHLLIDGAAVPALVGEPQPTGISTNNAIVVHFELSKQELERCMLVIDQRQYLNRVVPSLISQLNVSGNPVIGVAAFTEIFNPFEDYTDRPSAFVGQATGALIGAIVAFGTLRRSSELATYRLSGSSRRSVTQILVGEATFCALAFCVFAVSALFVLEESSVAAWAVSLETFSAGALIVLVASCAATLIVRRSPISLAKDR